MLDCSTALSKNNLEKGASSSGGKSRDEPGRDDSQGYAASLNEDDDDWKEIFVKNKSSVKSRHEGKKHGKVKLLSVVYV